MKTIPERREASIRASRAFPMLCRSILELPESPLLIGHLHKGDVVRDAKQKSWIDPQLNIFDFISG
ncbi:MAG: hypothetical protein PUG04_04930 [Lachnospiraceae bacterium]|nr:hypothetical protein [Lachnospiraceae bacterium]